MSDEQDAKLVKAVIAMANSLGMSVVSEGVESKDQLNFLLEANCEFIQGYYYSKPLGSDEFMSLLNKMPSGKANSKPLELISGIA